MSLAPAPGSPKEGDVALGGPLLAVTDLTPALVACLRAGELPYNPVADVHWTRAGAQAAGLAIADALGNAR